jgi:DNA-dependent RNA polymerase auxiliary subunit epsilon
MTSKEKQDELIMKQRAELAARKGTTVLDYEVEKRIGDSTMSVLEMELRKLLPNEGEGLDDIDVPEATIRRNKTSALHLNVFVDAEGRQRHLENEFAMELLHIMRTSKSFLG